MDYTAAWVALQVLDDDTREQVLDIAANMNLDLLGTNDEPEDA